MAMRGESMESSDMQQPTMSERSRKLTEQWLRKVADLDGRSRFVGNGLPVDGLGMEEAMQSARTEKLTNGRRLVDDEVDRPRRLAAGNHREGNTIFSSSRSWRSCNEEVIKKVIRESLLPKNSSYGDKAASSRSLGSYLRGGFNLPDHEGEKERKNTVAAWVQPIVMMKAPSLIGRLMGLEQVPAAVARPTEKPKPRDEQNPSPASLMLHLQKPERVTLGSIIEREKIERLMSKSSERCCKDLLGFSVSLVKEHPLSVAEAMQKPSWREEEKEDLSSCNCKLEHEEIISMSDRQQQQPEHELQRKEIRIFRKNKVEPSKNSKTPASVRHGQQQNAKALKKIDGSRWTGFSRDQLQSRKDVKAPAVPLSSSKKNAAASAEPQRGADTAKRNLLDKIERKLAFRNSNIPPEAKKDTRVKSAQKMITKSKIAKQNDGEEMSPYCKQKNAPPVISINTSYAAESRLQKQLSSKSSINEQTKRDQKMICEVMLKANKAAAAAAAVKLVDEKLIDPKRADKLECLESLLLGCRSFLLALGDADTCTHHKARDMNQMDKDVKPYLSCAEELILRKRHHQKLSSHPLLLKRCCSSAEQVQTLEQLVGEISRGIRRLTSYSEVDHEASSRDSLYVKLEKDLECMDKALDAVWDVDWRSTICVEEVDHVAGHLEEHVLSALVEEFAMEFMNCR